MTTVGVRRWRHNWQWPALLWLFGTLAVAAKPALAFESWVERRDAGVIRQSLDYSCGLAALATVLSDFGAPVSEKELLSALFADPAMPEGEPPLKESDPVARSSLTGTPDRDGVGRDISFADLARLARQRGFSALGVAVTLETLKNLRGPAIVAMDLDGRAHFSVLRAVAADGAALLADPSWGNRRLAAWEFERYFLTDASGADGARPLGRLLLLGHPDAPNPTPATGPEAGPPGWRWPVILAPFAS